MSPEAVRDGIVKRNKTWSYVVRITDPQTGARKPQWVGGYPTRAAAKAARDEKRRSLNRGDYVGPSGLTVREYLAGWLAAHAHQVKPKTLDDYRFMVRSYVEPHIGGLKLQDVRPATLTELYSRLLDRGGRGGAPLSKRTTDYVHSILRKAFNDAVVADQLLATNPAIRAKRPRVERQEVATIWSPAQLMAFLEQAETHRLYAFFWIATHTGARRGELLNLRWQDVHLERSSITITGSTGVVAGRRIQGTTKTGRSRIVTIDRRTVEVFRDHQARQLLNRLELGDLWPDTDLVFRTAMGDPLHPDTVSQTVPRIISRYNLAHPETPLPHARLHDLRHIHATTLLLAGQPVHVVAARLGHTDPSITLQVYAHVIQDKTANVADVFAAALRGSDPSDAPGRGSGSST